MHRWLYDLQITGNKRGVTNPFFSLPHHILFFFYLFLFSIVLLLLVSLLCNPCLSLTPLSPASFYFAFLCYTSVCFLCLLFSVSSPILFCFVSELLSHLPFSELKLNVCLTVSHIHSFIVSIKINHLLCFYSNLSHLVDHLSLLLI